MAVQEAPVNGAANIDKLKLEWTARQLELAQQAVFDDHELDFECQQDDQASAEVDDFAVPRCRHVNTKLTGLTTIAGLDISFFPDSADQAIVAVAVLSYPDMKLLFSAIKHVTLRAPYIPSFLSMREAEHMVNLIDHLRGIPECPFPQVFLIDGNGQLHERQAGLAVVVGVLANVSTIGVAKDYHPLHAATGQAEGQWRFEQKAFKRKCHQVLHKRGDWMGVFDTAGKDYIGGVSRGGHGNEESY